MIRGLFQRGVSLNLAGRDVRAATSTDLRNALAAHVPVSSARMADLGALGDRELSSHAAALDDLARQLGTALAGGDDPLALLAPADVALGRAWSDAVTGAQRWRRSQRAFRRALTEALLAHLGAERDCVRTLLANRGRGPGGGREPAVDPDPGLRQQLIFDPAALAGRDGEREDFDRLQKGDPLEVLMREGQALVLLLAQHRFLVVAGSPWLLVDELGADIKLRPGRNVVGRSVDCDAVVSESCRAVSRRHLVLETEGTRLLRITDLSSLGTFVPRAELDSQLH